MGLGGVGVNANLDNVTNYTSFFWKASLSFPYFLKMSVISTESQEKSEGSIRSRLRGDLNTTYRK